MKAFTTRILKEGGNYTDELPPNIRQIFSQKGYIPVQGTVNECSFKATLVPRKNYRYIPFIHYKTRKETGKGEYDKVTVSIEYDHEDRKVPVPEDVEIIFSEPVILETFLEMTPSHRQEIIHLINSAKRPETRLKYIERIREYVLETVKKKKIISNMDLSSYFQKFLKSKKIF